jgi:hypothetical protein
MNHAINKSEKLRVLQGDGNPVEVLIGVMGGLDLFESR